MKVKALIIDDESDICYLLSRLLQQKNYETTFVNSLKEARETLEQELPDLIVLDNHLPDGLSINYIPVLKEKYPAIKIIMITGHDSGDDRERALENGADYFIGKPFSKEIIHKAVEAVTREFPM